MREFMKIAVPLSGSVRAKEAAAGGRKRRPAWGWVLLLVVAGAATALGGYLFWQSQQPASAVTTVTVPVRVGDIQVTVESSGKVAASRAADLTFQMSGLVTQVLVKAGDVVTAGQTLVR